MEQLEDTEAVKEGELLPANQAKRNTDLPLYITASLNYKLLHQTFTIGDGISSTDPTSQRIFYNVPLQKQQTYYYFIRAYSTAHTTQVAKYMYNLPIKLTVTYLRKSGFQNKNAQ